MSRDVTRLDVFHVANELVLSVYKVTRSFPPEERYGLQSQLRRAAVSTPTNLVEGCARRSTRDYLRFVEVALSSASEARFLVGLAERLGLIRPTVALELAGGYTRVVKALQKLLMSLEHQP